MAQEYVLETISLLAPCNALWFPLQNSLQYVDSFWIKLEHAFWESPNALQLLIGTLCLGREQTQSEIKPPEEQRIQVPKSAASPNKSLPCLLNNHSLYDQQGKEQHMDFFPVKVSQHI